MASPSDQNQGGAERAEDEDGRLREPDGDGAREPGAVQLSDRSPTPLQVQGQPHQQDGYGDISGILLDARGVVDKGTSRRKEGDGDGRCASQHELGDAGKENECDDGAG